MSTAQEITYRPAETGDVELLTRMLWIAFNWRDETVSEQHWPDPTAAAKYVDGFGRHGDAGVVAEVAGQDAGAAWYRLLPAHDRGYGFVAPDIPELTLGVASQARGRGTGDTSCLRSLWSRRNGATEVSEPRLSSAAAIGSAPWVPRSGRLP